VLEKDDSEALTDSQRLAMTFIFDISLYKIEFYLNYLKRATSETSTTDPNLATLYQKDLQLAGQIGELARRQNVDGCEGGIFSARLAIAQKKYTDALTRLNECLEQKPIYSHAYMLRSNVNYALGNKIAAIEDGSKAMSLNPLNASFAKRYSLLLIERNRNIDISANANLTPEQIIEAWSALDRARALNVGDLELLGLYADYMGIYASSVNPSAPALAAERALTIRQTILKNSPTANNALKLAEMAFKMAQEPDEKQKQFLLGLAGASFEQARTLGPQNSEILSKYAEYYRFIGQPAKAEALLAQSQDKMMLANQYFRSGKYDQAVTVLEQLYNSDPNNTNIIRNLLTVAVSTRDTEAVKKFSDELIAVEDNAGNRLQQIVAFLNTGLTREAANKVQSFKEKYPNNSEIIQIEAMLAMKQGDLDKAMELVNLYLATNQDNAFAWELKAEINYHKGLYDLAILDFTKSYKLSQNPSTQFKLAKAYFYAKRAEEAITELISVIKNPQTAQEGRRLLEKIYSELKRPTELQNLYDTILEKDPNNVYWNIQAGKFALAQQKYDRAEKLYRKALEESKSTSLEAFKGYFSVLLQKKRYDKVFEDGREYIDKDFAPIAFLTMGTAKKALGDETAAREYCRKALDKSAETEAFTPQILSGMYKLLGAEEVSNYCREKLEKNPESLSANWTMHQWENLNGNYNKALEYIGKCIDIIGPDDNRRSDYLAMKATVLQLAYNKTSDNIYLDRAIAVYESLLAEKPNDKLYLNNLAYMLTENNERLPKALEYAERGHEAEPYNPGYMDTYAYALYKNNKFPEAEKLLQVAVQRYEQDDGFVPWEVYEHLGMVKEKLGAKEQAVAAYQNALNAGKDKMPEKVKVRIEKAIELISD